MYVYVCVCACMYLEFCCMHIIIERKFPLYAGHIWQRVNIKVTIFYSILYFYLILICVCTDNIILFSTDNVLIFQTYSLVKGLGTRVYIPDLDFNDLDLLYACTIASHSCLCMQ